MSNQPTLTNEQIKAQKAQRLKLCAAEIEAVLIHYECDLVAVPVEEGAKTDAKVTLVLK